MREPESPVPAPELDQAEKARAWDAVAAELNRLAPDWNDPADGVRAPGDAARQKICQIANAAEWGEYSTLRHHVGNEAAAVRHMLTYPGLPEGLKSVMQAHLMRLQRMR